MPDCLDENTAAAYLERTLDPARVCTIDDHLDGCAGCRELLARVAGIFGRFADPPSDQAAEQAAPPAETPETYPIERGTTVGRYVVVDLVGVGGMGAVYLAYDPELDRRVALKVLRADRVGDRRVSFEARLRREAQVLARLEHPNVIAVYDIGNYAGSVFVAMPFIAGKTLRGWLEERQRPWREVLRVMIAAGAGLSAAHRAGLVHRDIKPENIMVGDGQGVWVTDFGLARTGPGVDDAPGPQPEVVAGPDAAANLTQPGETLGTPAYMAPEQRRGHPVDPRCDQFSFCMTLVEALTAIRPVAPAGASLPPSGVPAWLLKTLERGRAAEPADRFPDMDRLLAAIARDPARRRRRILGLSALLLAVALSTWGLAALLGAGGRFCQDGGERLAGAWDDPVRAGIERAFRGSGLPYAADSWQGVRRILDGFARDWAAAYREACEATRVRGTQSEQLLDLRMICLRERKEDLAALTRLLGQGGEDVIRKAVEAAGNLRGLEACGRAALLLGKVPPPDDPAARRELEAIERRSSEARALRGAGRYAQALELAGPLEVRAQAVGHLPTRAEIQLLVANLQDETGEPRRAERTLLDALWAAEAGRHDDAAARTWIELVQLRGDKLARYEEAQLAGERAGAAIARLGGDPRLEAELATELGNTLREQGKPDLALAQHQRALAQYRALRPPDERGILKVQNSLGMLAYNRSAFREALEMFQDVRARLVSALGERHPDVALVDVNLGHSFLGLGKYAQAEACFRRAHDCEEAALGPEHPALAGSGSGLGAVLYRLGNYPEALEHFTRAYQILERSQGADHPEVASILTNMGSLLGLLGRYREASDAFQRALPIIKKARGAGHPTVAATLQKLGNLYVRDGRYLEAEQTLARALSIARKSAGPEAEITGLCLSSLAGLAQACGRHQDALRQYREVIEIFEKVYGAWHPHVAATLDSLGDSLLAAGRTREAEKAFQRAVEILMGAVGPDHPQTQAIRAKLARTPARAE